MATVNLSENFHKVVKKFSETYEILFKIHLYENQTKQDYPQNFTNFWPVFVWWVPGKVSKSVSGSDLSKYPTILVSPPLQFIFQNTPRFLK